MKPSRNIDQLRHEIDQGQAGDKVPATDPAAAPLGTDAEAGGHPPSDKELQLEGLQINTRSPKRSVNPVLIYVTLETLVGAYIVAMLLFGISMKT